MSNTVRVTAVNHVAQDIACSPDEVYREILSAYIDSGRFLKAGYGVTPLPDSDLAAFRGGYRLTMTGEGGELVDDRICRVTERDDQARRISLCADYLLPTQMGLTVHATYHAVATPTGAQYRLDCHTDIDIEAPADDARAKIAEIVAGFEEQSEAYLKTYLGQTKEKLEAQG